MKRPNWTFVLPFAQLEDEKGSSYSVQTHCWHLSNVNLHTIYKFSDWWRPSLFLLSMKGSQSRSDKGHQIPILYNIRLQRHIGAQRNGPYCDFKLVLLVSWVETVQNTSFLNLSTAPCQSFSGQYCREHIESHLFKPWLVTWLFVTVKF